MREKNVSSRGEKTSLRGKTISERRKEKREFQVRFQGSVCTGRKFFSLRDRGGEKSPFLFPQIRAINPTKGEGESALFLGPNGKSVPGEGKKRSAS